MELTHSPWVAAHSPECLSRTVGSMLLTEQPVSQACKLSSCTQGLDPCAFLSSPRLTATAWYTPLNWLCARLPRSEAPLSGTRSQAWVLQVLSLSHQVCSGSLWSWCRVVVSASFLFLKLLGAGVSAALSVGGGLRWSCQAWPCQRVTSSQAVWNRRRCAGPFWSSWRPCFNISRLTEQWYLI